jgi:integrase
VPLDELNPADYPDLFGPPPFYLGPTLTLPARYAVAAAIHDHYIDAIRRRVGEYVPALDPWVGEVRVRHANEPESEAYMAAYFRRVHERSGAGVDSNRLRTGHLEGGDSSALEHEAAWLMIIPCQDGHICPWGGDNLAACTNRGGRIVNKLKALAFATVAQDGDDGAKIVFPAERFEEVAAVMKPRRRRRLSHLQAEMRRKGLAEATIKGNLAHLKAALRWAERIGLLVKAPRIDMPRRAKATDVMKGRPITTEEFDRLLPTAPEFAEFLLATPEANRTGRVFQPRARLVRGERLGHDRVSEIVRRIGQAAGVKVRVDPRTARVEFASAHDLRRSFGQRWAARVMPAVLQELMRHEVIETTLRYYVGRNSQNTARTLWEAHKKAAGGNISGNSRQTTPQSTAGTADVRDCGS